MVSRTTSTNRTALRSTLATGEKRLTLSIEDLWCDYCEGACGVGVYSYTMDINTSEWPGKRELVFCEKECKVGFMRDAGLMEEPNIVY